MYKHQISIWEIEAMSCWGAWRGWYVNPVNCEIFWWSFVVKNKVEGYLQIGSHLLWFIHKQRNQSNFAVYESIMKQMLNEVNKEINSLEISSVLFQNLTSQLMKHLEFNFLRLNFRLANFIVSIFIS